MSTAKSLTALQPFLAQADSATGETTANLVLQATQAPEVFVFSELLTHPNIAALRDSEDGRPYYSLLELFAYGSWADYQAQASSLPPLTEAHKRKLKQLTLLSLCSSGPTNLTYSHLLATLSLPSVRALEDLVITCIYSSLITGKLDTKSSFIEVTACAGRDVSPSDLPIMVSTLNQWLQQCDAVVADIDAQTNRVRDDSARLKREQDEYDAAVAKRKEEIMDELKYGPDSEKGKSGKGKRVISDSGEDRSTWEDVEMEGAEEGYGNVWGEPNQGKRRTKRVIGGSKRR
ncbi:hypothetical protein EX30DRAFT_329044 [Ascodesmis nigricans]|uniref:PCI domain-containing protein n=1 Tax=Ascodesmis nigricans TaxID=341454 RepID=A0A4S2N1Q2_9PEZI|nr:hypothetical protein EX30DRAFT_329044 [Ascodesmis nigricans]